MRLIALKQASPYRKLERLNMVFEHDRDVTKKYFGLNFHGMWVNALPPTCADHG
jgi:hypothetical protein